MINDPLPIVNFRMTDHLSVILTILITPIIFFLIFKFYKRRLTPLSPPVEKREQPDSDLPENLAEEDKELIRNIREFHQGIVREVMIPRIDVVAVEETTDLEGFRQVALEKGYSRIPVYRETIDRIIGIAHIKDMLRYWGTNAAEMTVTTCMRPPYFVPETKNIGILLHEFQAQKVHMAIVIDEYGGTAGIVTIEDLIEEIFGDIVDEHDGEEEVLIRVLNDQTFEVNAKAGISDLEEYVGELTIAQQNFETVGGLLFSILGEIPKQGETVTYQHLKFTILQADRHRIVTIKVERLPETPTR